MQVPHRLLLLLLAFAPACITQITLLITSINLLPRCAAPAVEDKTLSKPFVCKVINMHCTLDRYLEQLFTGHSSAYMHVC